MPTYGPRDTSLLAMPTGWDAAVLEKYALSDGTSFATVAAMLNGAVQAESSRLYSDSLWSQLVSYTDNPTVDEYSTGASNGFEEFTEYGRPDPKRAGTEGHMLPIKPYDRALAWTWYYLRNARMSQIEADIADAVKDMGDLWRVRILTRLLKRTDDSGAAAGLGTGGYSPGFATTAGSTNVDFAPPAYGGVTFATTHEHYVAIAGGVFTAAVFADIKAELLEHGHNPPYNVIVGMSDETTIRGLTGFVPVSEMGIQYSANTELAQFGADYRADGYNIGVINDCYVRVVRGLPQYYAFGWKNYGPNSQRNPLRIRLPKGASRPTFEVHQDPRSNGSAAYPLQWASIFTEFGVGVGADRTNGTARYTNNATWADGTPT
jgi:hypothetical protein